MITNFGYNNFGLNTRSNALRILPYYNTHKYFSEKQVINELSALPISKKCVWIENLKLPEVEEVFKSNSQIHFFKMQLIDHSFHFTFSTRPTNVVKCIIKKNYLVK